MSDSESSCRVLVVDDEAAICRIVTRTLERNGFEAASVSVPGDLERMLSEEAYDVVLLDRSMGPTDGSSLLPLVRQHAPRAKVLFFTGDLVDSSELEDVDGIVQKPINGKELAATIRRLI